MIDIFWFYKISKIQEELVTAIYKRHVLVAPVEFFRGLAIWVGCLAYKTRFPEGGYPASGWIFRDVRMEARETMQIFAGYPASGGVLRMDFP